MYTRHPIGMCIPVAATDKALRHDGHFKFAWLMWLKARLRLGSTSTARLLSGIGVRAHNASPVVANASHVYTGSHDALNHWIAWREVKKP